MKNRILIVVTNSDVTPAGKPTGLWLEEFTVPYQLFIDAGFKVDVASIKGGQSPIDPRSNPTDEQSKEWVQGINSLQSTINLSEVSPESHDAVFFPGGHGAMFDLPNDSNINSLLRNYQENNKVISAVCHGPACFIGVSLENGNPLITGRTVTGFTNEEEVQAEQDKNMPFLLENELLRNKANYIKASEWSDHIEVDDNIITGQNPQSSESVAKAIIKKLTT